MTIKETIGDYHISRLQVRLSQLKGFKAPQIILQKLEEEIAKFQAGNFKVKGLSKKYPVGDTPVQVISAKNMETYVYYTQSKRVGVNLVPTYVIKMETTNGTYYYDAANNMIENSLSALNVSSSQDQGFKILTGFSR